MFAALLSLVVGLFVAGFFGTRMFIRYAARADLIDVPNVRSSHSVAVPRGGGLVFSVLALAGFGAWWAFAPGVDGLVGVFPITCFGVLVLGFVDDRLSLPALLRLSCQVVAGAVLVLSLGPVPALPLLGAWEIGHQGALFALCTVGLVWLTNLYNFMDGIDALAAGEGLFVASSGAVLCAVRGEFDIAVWLLLLGAPLGGFICWNLPPAKVFMGDAGSVFLGFFFGGVMLLSHDRGGPEIWVWLILLGLFSVDATVTLLRRVRFGQRPLEAHRTHAYQYLSRRYESHGTVTAASFLVNLCWLAPLALVATLYPAYGMVLLLVAYAPLVAIAFEAGAGVPESQSFS